ncbi:hypothetical protein BDV29DRAFT_152658 [Aspergillus leporis]|uniref:Uncharacterized protein n=1 Tax=Aspergillus leporis TaxID=41062 RepID=A0A5N5XEG2_9EURO|nr:hypothetical protein BDV29DRAFT_152658 [Aspergillus leporis]
MARAAEINGAIVLQSSSDRVTGRLLALLDTTEARINDILTATVVEVAHDYRFAIIDPQVRTLIQVQIEVKDKVTDIIQSTEAKIRLDRLLGLSNGSASPATIDTSEEDIEVGGSSEEEPMVKREAAANIKRTCGTYRPNLPLWTPI